MKIRRAFSLVELLVVIAILGILVSLLMSAVQRARSAAILTRCEANLKQIGLGLAQFYDHNGKFPSNGGWDGSQQILSSTNVPFTPETYDYYTGVHYKWGVGDPDLPPTEQTGSWAYSILPFLEEDHMFDNREWTQGEPLYACPARRTSDPVYCVAGDAYADYISGGWQWGKTDYAGNRFAIQKRPICHPENDFERGLSNTIFIGEKAFDPSVQGANWYYDEPFFLGGNAGTIRRGTELLRDGPGISFQHNWGSKHIAGVNFLFGDGSVRPYAFGTDQTTMAEMLSLQ
jgi:prepilin-type N-terminal cleavage/methylation domain-containing protein/prepilin-type processing-associated H-X9-DG protein